MRQPDLPVAAPAPAEPYYDIEVKQWLIDYVPTEFRDAALADLDALLVERQQDKERIERLETALKDASLRLGDLTRPPFVPGLTGLIAEVRDAVRAALAVEEDARD